MSGRVMNKEDSIRIALTAPTLDIEQRVRLIASLDEQGRVKLPDGSLMDLRDVLDSTEAYF